MAHPHASADSMLRLKARPLRRLKQDWGLYLLNKRGNGPSNQEKTAVKAQRLKHELCRAIYEVQCCNGPI